MNKQLTFKQYRTMDLCIMAALLAFTQILICLAVHQWYLMGKYIVSPVAIITALVLMRWGPWAAIHAALGGVIFTMFSPNSTWEHYLIYGAGNLLSMAALLYFKLFGKERIRNSSFLTVVFVISVQGLMLLGRTAVALVLQHSWAESMGLITTDLLSVLFTAVAGWIARRTDGLFEDQKHFLLRIQEEHK